MNRAEAEKLLGGYATGTLSEMERRQLFEAALEHQTLFDALADEEPLRELLADPIAKARLLRALAPRVVPKGVPFWRRPALVSAVAGVAVCLAAGVVFLRLPSRPSLESSPSESGPSMVAAAPVSPPPPALNDGADSTMGLPHASFDRAVTQDAVAVRPKASPMRERIERAARPETDEANRSKALRVESALPTGRVEPSVPAPTWSVEPLGQGLVRVTVTTTQQLATVLLERDPDRGPAVALSPHAGPEIVDGKWRWRYEVKPRAGAALDLYVLSREVAAPAALAESAPVGGFYARIYSGSGESTDR